MSRLPAGMHMDLWDGQMALEQVISEYDVVMPSHVTINGHVIRAGSKLRLIQQPAAGVENINLAAARECGIPVCNAPGTNHRAVAELALFMMLAVARRLPAAQSAFCAGRIGEPEGRELGGATLGIVGKGRSGTELAGLAAGFGMAVKSVDSGSNQAEWTELLATSDVISLHCPLSDRTLGLFDDSMFARMKSGAILVNCARGPVIDRAALERALDSGRLAGVALDVFWNEPWDPDDPLFARSEVFVTPHIAGSTRESFARIAEVCIDNLERVARGEKPLHRVA